MTGEIIPGIYEDGIIKPSKKLDITGKRDVLIIFKEKKKESMVDSIIKKIQPVEEKVIDEAIELTELGEGFE
jgi:predicted DNA-binding antitoxin AbrB/MazE fold protein